ncbi:exo-alpha-sialidase [Micromonospora sp. AMSO31t]|uniref:WD40/YVTN/BNR-like repeat-containing protein n=1 Tax=Micromonospora sp. AMSO31t TaxID=2650566 RepID=UPI00124B7507|nr:exo-alpha-sialidase [Micromonospora sp. AMSO31t]KAB1910937.1 exo-alpha-sialidase [Micromonospora sp. AMSO31t]
MVLVVFASMAVVPLAAATHRVDWADPTPHPQARDRATQLFMTGPDSGVGVEQVDFGCTVQFAHTEDGGQSWTDYDTAQYRATSCRVTASGNKEADMEFSVLGQRSYLVLDGGKSRLSTDYGRTWRDTEQAMVAVPAFPPKARAVFCQQGCGAIRQPLAVDPLSGTVYRLSGKPASPYPPYSIYPSADGTIWATYWPDDIDIMIVARSTDRGATWNIWRPAKGANVIAVAGVSKREAYLLIEPPPPPGAQPMEVKGPSQLLHTTDGGATWKDVGSDLPASPTNRPFTIGSDGSLLVAQPGDITPALTSSLLVSRDGGRHFTKAREYDRLDGAVGAAPGLAWLYGRDDTSALGADHTAVTRDGSSWARLDLPH